MIKTTTLAATILTTLFAVNASAGQLTIENGKNAVSITAGANNTLVVNGKTFNGQNSTSNNGLKIHDVSGKVIGDFITETSNPLGGLMPLLKENTWSNKTQAVLPAGTDGAHFTNSTIMGKFNLNGNIYTASIGRDLRLRNAIMLYSDSSCTQAEYVITKTIAGGAWGRNTIVADGNSLNAYLVGDPIWDDNGNADLTYGYVSDNNDYNKPLCKPVDLSDDQFGVSSLKPLPNGIIESDKFTFNDGLTGYEHYLNVPNVTKGALYID